MAPKYDLVLLGATGFTGRLCTEYMTKHLPSTIRWAIAGRSQKKLDEFATELDIARAGGAVESVDTSSNEAILELAKSTRVLINVIGPYCSTCGTAVFKACAENGTHYVDVAGEPPWRRDMIYQYGKAAKKSGAKMITTCGFSSVPADLTTSLAVFHLHSHTSLPAREAIGCLYEIRGSFSGGSIASACSIHDVYGSSVVAEASSPFAISPVQPASPALGHESEIFPKRNVLGVQNVNGLGHLVRGSDAGVEESVIGRTWGLHRSSETEEQTHGFGPKFRYYTRIRAPNAFIAIFMNVALKFLAFLLAHSLTRNLVRFLVPAGTGPSAESRKTHGFEYRTIATTGGEQGKRAVASIKCDLDGYEFTAVTLTEAALLLLEAGGSEIERRGGGVYTPALLGKEFVEKLQTPKIGAKISVELLDS